MGSFVLYFALLLFAIGASAMWAFWDFRRFINNLPADSLGDDEVVTSHATAEVASGEVGHASAFFLERVRSQSCYPVLRTVHGVATFLGVAVCVLAGIAAMGSQDSERWSFAIAAAVLAALLLVEYGFFRMIVDAVDVLIEIGRHTTAEKSDDTSSGPG